MTDTTTHRIPVPLPLERVGPQTIAVDRKAILEHERLRLPVVIEAIWLDGERITEPGLAECVSVEHRPERAIVTIDRDDVDESTTIVPVQIVREDSPGGGEGG